MNHPVANSFYPIANATSSTSPFVEIFLARDPTGNDFNYQVQQRWWNTVTNDEWILVGFSSAGGIVQAIWEEVQSTSTILALQPDVGAAVIPTGGTVAITGMPTGAGSSSLDTNFETFNAGTSSLQIAHRYQGAVTTSDGAGQTQTILTVPITVASVMNVSAQLAGIEATPTGVGGEISGTVFRGAGAPTLLGVPDKVVRASAAIAASTFNVNVSGNNLIVTVTGVATFTIEWYIIAEIVEKTFI